MKEIEEFIKISKYAGERFDLIQAGGGNSSVKLKKDQMIIKASGFLLSDVDEENGYSKVNTKKIANIINNSIIINEVNKGRRESLTFSLVQDATIDKSKRPSIETLLHSILHKYTLHTHPVVVNMIVVQKNWKEVLLSIFNDDKIALVDYYTPGIDLALELNKSIQKLENIPKIIFLQNHGLIVTSESSQDISLLTEYVLRKIESFLNIDMTRYKLTNKITNLFNSISNNKNNNISYLSDDSYLNNQLNINPELFNKKPFCPDGLVFCGLKCIKINNILKGDNILNYKLENFSLPKVVIYENNLFFIAKNISKAKEMEEVMKFNIMVLEQNMNNNINFLEIEELKYLNNWEAEKYRQKL